MKTPHEYAWELAQIVRNTPEPSMRVVDQIEDYIRKVIQDAKNEYDKRA